MKNLRNIIAATSTVLLLSLGQSALAAESIGNASTALKHSGQAIKHGAIASGQLVSGAVAVPLVVVGEAGKLSGKAGETLMNIATDNEPLDISDTSVTAAPSPAAVMGTQVQQDDWR